MAKLCTVASDAEERVAPKSVHPENTKHPKFFFFIKGKFCELIAWYNLQWMWLECNKNPAWRKEHLAPQIVHSSTPDLTPRARPIAPRAKTFPSLAASRHSSFAMLPSYWSLLPWGGSVILIFEHKRRNFFCLKPCSNGLRKTWFKFLGTSPSKCWPNSMRVWSTLWTLSSYINSCLTCFRCNWPTDDDAERRNVLPKSSFVINKASSSVLLGLNQHACFCMYCYEKRFFEKNSPKKKMACTQTLFSVNLFSSASSCDGVIKVGLFMYKIPDFSLAPCVCKQAGLDLVYAWKDLDPRTLVIGRPSPFLHDCSLRCAFRRSHLKLWFKSNGRSAFVVLDPSLALKPQEAGNIAPDCHLTSIAIRFCTH